jgi:DNA translocase FtsK/SpoIIIE-like protein
LALQDPPNSEDGLTDGSRESFGSSPSVVLRKNYQTVLADSPDCSADVLKEESDVLLHPSVRGRHPSLEQRDRFVGLWYILSRQPPLRSRLDTSMHPLNPQFDLLKLRRQLEEILVMVKSNHNGADYVRSASEDTVVSTHENNSSIAKPDAAPANECLESRTACETVMLKCNQPDERDDLYDDALVVITEFGQASPAVLQMWLSIDYGRAITILNRFQADGLVSSKGRIRHKAYSLRRSKA